jgi:hypothetical protein
VLIKKHPGIYQAEHLSMKINGRIIIHLLVCGSTMLAAVLACNAPASAGSILAIAIKHDGTPSMILYFGDPQEHPFSLPAGD